MNPRILYLSYDGLTDPLGQSQVMPYVEGLSLQGFSFTVISFEKPDRFEREKNVIQSWAIKHGVNWLPQTYHKRPPILSTVLDLFVMWRVTKREFQSEKFQIVHCRSYLSSLVGLRAKQKWASKFIFDMRGFWADERVEGGLWNLKNPVFQVIYSFFKRKERQFIRNADHVISLTHNAKNVIESWERDIAISVIPTCVDVDFFDPTKLKPVDRELLRKDLGLKDDDFVLLYLGSWGTWYMTNDMLQFFSDLRAENSRAKFLIISGDHVDLAGYQWKADVLTRYVPRSEVPMYISLASAAICFVQPSFSKRASSATKIGEIMAMNVPVIANSGWGDIAVIQQQAGILCYEKGQRMANVLEQIMKQGKHRQFCERQMSLKLGIESYRKVYVDLIGSSNR